MLLTVQKLTSVKCTQHLFKCNIYFILTSAVNFNQRSRNYFNVIGFNGLN